MTKQMRWYPQKADYFHRFSIKPTFSRTLREAGKSGNLIRGGYKRVVKAAEGQWKVTVAQAGSHEFES